MGGSFRGFLAVRAWMGTGWFLDPNWGGVDIPKASTDRNRTDSGVSQASADARIYKLNNNMGTSAR